ncbi:MAG: dual specificity protein phosphatase family protein, partial [Campylobacter curvus]
LGVSFFLVALAYLLFGCEIFRKGQNGRLQTAAKILLLPYLLVARINIFYWLRHDSLYDEILPSVYLGSIVAAPKFSAILDLTAECEYRPQNTQIYENFALLDMTQPSLSELCSAAAKLNELVSLGERTLVCCALGYGRSAVVLAAWLAQYKNFSVQEAITLIKSSRKGAVIERYENLLENFKKELKC